MKSIKVLLSLGVFTLLFSSCNNDDLLKYTAHNEFETNKSSIVTELKTFTKYSMDGAKNLYDVSSDYLDLNKLDKYIYEFDFSFIDKSRTINDIYYSVNYEDELKNILSLEAYNLLIDYWANRENINWETLEKIRNDFSAFTESDREFFEMTYNFVNVIFNELITIDGVNSRVTATKVACNILAGLGGSAAGWIWGAAFGGPVGFAINVAWNIAATVAATYRC